jgi:hypothetical protein
MRDRACAALPTGGVGSQVTAQSVGVRVRAYATPGHGDGVDLTLLYSADVSRLGHDLSLKEVWASGLRSAFGRRGRYGCLLRSSRSPDRVVESDPGVQLVPHKLLAR